MSLDNAEIDLEHSFAFGMGYVALSRVRKLSGIRLIGFKPSALLVDPQVSAFDKGLRTQSKDNELLFSKLTKGEQEKLEREFILRMDGTLQVSKITNDKTSRLKNVPTHLLTKELLDKGMDLKEIAKERGYTFGTIIHHLEDVMKEFPVTIITHLRPDQRNIDIVKKANDALKADDKLENKGKLAPLKFTLEKMGHKMSYEDIRLARLFI